MEFSGRLAGYGDEGYVTAKACADLQVSESDPWVVMIQKTKEEAGEWGGNFVLDTLN